MLRWGLLAAGNIAWEFADGVQKSQTGKLVAVAAREQSRADALGDRFEIPRRYGSYEELLADPDVDAIYVSTVHRYHAQWAMRAAEAGKHVLCEKPMAMNEAEVAAVIEAARHNGVFLAEAFMYRFHPQTEALVELIRGGRLGTVRAVDVAFSYQLGLDQAPRVTAHGLGGGGILDVGCYCASMSRLVAQTATGLDVAEPKTFEGAARLDRVERIDLAAVAVVVFPGEMLAQLSCAVDVVAGNHVRVFGTDAWAEVPVPAWLPPNRQPGISQIVLHDRDGGVEVMTVHADKALFSYEADGVAHHLGERQAPQATWADSIANARMLDTWRREVGLRYDFE